MLNFNKNLSILVSCRGIRSLCPCLKSSLPQFHMWKPRLQWTGPTMWAPPPYAGLAQFSETKCRKLALGPPLGHVKLGLGLHLDTWGVWHLSGHLTQMPRIFFFSFPMRGTSGKALPNATCKDKITNKRRVDIIRLAVHLTYSSWLSVITESATLS